MKRRIDSIQMKKCFKMKKMIYLLVPHSSALQTDTTKFKQDFIGPLFIDTAIDRHIIG